MKFIFQPKSHDEITEATIRSISIYVYKVRVEKRNKQTINDYPANGNYKIIRSRMMSVNEKCQRFWAKYKKK